MISSLYRILSKTRDTKFRLIIYRMIKLFLNLYYPIHCKLFKLKKNKAIVDGVVVSLTTFPARIESVWIVIQTLLRQTYRPERIILWLADSQFENRSNLPSNLLELEKEGLEIRFCDDLRSHKKYYYVMKEFPNHSIITVDDDTFYPENLVEKLVDTSKKYPNTICCNLAHEISFNNGEILPYSEWRSGADDCDIPSHKLVPIGCEGVLYPPNSMDSNLFDIQLIKKLCPIADDLWLKSMGTIKGTKAVKTESKSITYANLLTSKIEALNLSNVQDNKNDEQLKNIMNLFPQLIKIWCEEE